MTFLRLKLRVEPVRIPGQEPVKLNWPKSHFRS